MMRILRLYLVLISFSFPRMLATADFFSEPDTSLFSSSNDQDLQFNGDPMEEFSLDSIGLHPWLISPKTFPVTELSRSRAFIKWSGSQPKRKSWRSAFKLPRKWYAIEETESPELSVSERSVRSSQSPRCYKFVELSQYQRVTKRQRNCRFTESLKRASKLLHRISQRVPHDPSRVWLGLLRRRGRSTSWIFHRR